MILSKATLSDINSMQILVSQKVKEGIILDRSVDEIATNIRSYVVVKIDDKLIGYGALHIHSFRLAEIRSLIVHSDYRGQNIGRSIVEFAINEAKNLKIKEDVLVLTYLPQFFIKLGFEMIDKSLIPEHKIWTDCIKCIHFPICDEIALVYKV